MDNSLLDIFDKVWPKTMYYSTWSLARFGVNLKICKKSNFDCNQHKVSTQHKYILMHQKM